MNATAKPAGAGKLDAVQLLRALAALLVVVSHVMGTARHNAALFGYVPPLPFPGAAGVDAFFLVSGFIMVLASGRMFGSVAGSRDFALRRLVRILPLYWGTTVLILVLMLAGSRAFPSFAAIASSFLFFPFDTTGRADGFAFPIVDLGWTLNYEMMFYVVFAAFIPLGRTRAVAGVAATMVVLVALGLWLSPAAVPLRFWTQPIILEFVAGMLVAMAYVRGMLVLPAAARVALIAVAGVLYVVDPFGVMGLPTTPNDIARVLGWGFPGALLLVAAISGPTTLTSRPARIAVLLGDASYALYLLHPFVLTAMERVAARVPLPAPAGAVIFVAVTILAACIGAIAVHVLVERPVTTWLTRRLQRGGVPIGAVPLPPDARISPRK